MLIKINGRVHKVKLENCFLEPYEIANLMNEAEEQRLSEIVWNLKEETTVSLIDFIHRYFKRTENV